MRSRVVRVVLVFLVLLTTSGVFVAPVAAQDNGATPTPTYTGTNTDSNTTSNNSSGGMVPSMPEFPDWFVDPGTWLEDRIAGVSDGLEGFVETFNRVIYGLPSPGQMDDTQSWSDAENGWWPAVWSTYKVLAAFAFWIIGMGAMMSWNKPAPERRKGMKRALNATLMVLFGFWLTAGGLHLGNSISLAIAPSGSEFVQTPGSLGKLGLGMTLGAVLIFAKAAIILIGIFVLMAQWFLAHIVVAFWPLLWGMRAVPIDSIRAIGSIGVASLSTLIVLKIFQSVIMRFLFEIPWSLGHPETMLPTLVGTTVGLVVTNIWLPKLAVSKLLPASMMIVGQSSARTTADGAKRIRERANDVGSRVRERAPTSRVTGGTQTPSSTSTSGSGSGSAVGSESSSSSRSVGTVQTRSSSYSRPGGRAGETRDATRQRRNDRRSGYKHEETRGYE